MKTSNVSSKVLPLVLKAGFAIFLLSLVLSNRPALAQTVNSQGVSFGSCAIDLSGNLYVWGFDNYSQAVSSGNYATPPSGAIKVDSIPVKVAFPNGVTKWTAVSIGLIHTLAIGDDGNLYTWGDNTFGELGDGTFSSSPTPVLVPKPNGVTSWIAVAAGGYHSLAIGNDGNLYAWGHDNVGQVGDGATADASSPVKINLPSGVKAVAVAAEIKTSFVLGSDGNIYAWGSNSIGEFGDGTTTSSTTPVVISKPSGVTSWTKIVAGTYFSLALGNDGNLYSWGQDWNGQLGDGTIKGDTTSPTKVILPSGVTGWKNMACGGQFALAIGNNDSLYAWGKNDEGQLGVVTGNTSSNPTPVKVSLPNGILASSIATGYDHSLIMGSDGNVYSWGRNVEGQLGINNTTDSLTPVKVLGVGGTGNLVLPVELTSFTAIYNSNEVTLNWETSTETNNKGFEIEKKINNSWMDLGFVNGKGNSTGITKYSYVDKIDNSFNDEIFYRLKQVDFNGTSKYSKQVEVNIETGPKEFTLYPNYPNPFNPSTMIKYNIPKTSQVSINVYNAVGEEVASLVNAKQAPGKYSVEFNASRLASGVYFLRMCAGNFLKVQKMMLLK